MRLRIDEILLCANFYYPSLKIVACIDGTKKALNSQGDTNKVEDTPLFDFQKFIIKKILGVES